jgi:hypothetical protein
MSEVRQYPKPQWTNRVVLIAAAIESGFRVVESARLRADGGSQSLAVYDLVLTPARDMGIDIGLSRASEAEGFTATADFEGLRYLGGLGILTQIDRAYTTLLIERSMQARGYQTERSTTREGTTKLLVHF